MQHSKEKDLQPVSNRKSSPMKRILLEQGSTKAWSNVGCNQIKNVDLCWSLERQGFESMCGNLKFQETGRQPIKLGGGGDTHVIIIISLFILQFSSFLIF